MFEGTLPAVAAKNGWSMVFGVLATFGSLAPGVVEARANAASASFAAAADEQLDEILARLDSDSALARNAAEAVLCDALVPTDGPRLVAWSANASAEGRARVAAALARRDRHLGLVLELRTAGGEARAIGEAALDGLVARFDPALFDAPLVDAALWRRLEELGRTRSAPLGRLDFTRAPFDVLRDLARFDGLPLRLVVDPALVHSPLPAAAGAVVIGDWRDMLREAVLRHDLAFEAHLEEPDAARDRAPILAVRVTRRGLEGRLRGRDLLARWLDQFAAPERPIERVAAARALASFGWPAAQEFLVRRWRERGDVDALVGLLAGAELGTAPPSFPTRDDARRALDLVRADLATASAARGVLARDVLEGFVALPRIAPDGGALFADESGAPLVLVPALEDTERSAASAAFARFALELTARARLEAPGLDVRLRTWIEAPASEVLPRERLWALAAHARCVAEPAPTPSDVFALLATAGTRFEAQELSALLAASAAPSPSAWSDPTALAPLAANATGWPRAVALSWCLALRDAERAAAVVRSAFPARVGEAWHRVELATALEHALALGEQALVRDVLARAATGSVAAGFTDELGALCGALDLANDLSTADALYARAVERRDEDGHGDPLLLGALAASGAGIRARQLLLGELVGALEGSDEERSAAVLAGLERAVWTWFRARRDGEAVAFVSAVKRLARERRSGPLAALVLAAEWPRGAGPAPIDLTRPLGFE